jgi:hypothetical protein
MAIYDISGNQIAVSSSGMGGGEITETVVQEDINIMATCVWYEGNRLVNGGKDEWTGQNGWATSEYIPCKSAEEIRFEFTTKNLTPAIYCYDSAKALLGYVSGNVSVAGESQTIVAMENTAFIRFTIQYSYVQNGQISAYISQAVSYYDFTDTAQKRWRINEENANRDKDILCIDAMLHNYRKWNGKSLVTDGNSLVDSCDWGTDLAEFLGMTHTNCGLSGSMLVPATWTVADIKDNVNDNYPDAVDLVMLQGDTNGAMDGEASDQMDGDEPKTTWTARMNYLIRCIKARFHNVVIVLMPDSVRFDNMEKNRTAYSAMKALAEYNRLAFFGFDHSTPYNPLHDDNYYSRLGYGSGHTTQDVVHPYEPYNVAKGRALAHWVAGLVFDPNAPNTAATNWQDTV